jgi:geranylgeranyl diphosphate synthase type II
VTISSRSALKTGFSRRRWNASCQLKLFSITVGISKKRPVKDTREAVISALLSTPELLALRRSEIESALNALLPDPGAAPHRLHAAMRYALLSPGKRIRPLLALLCAEQLGCERERALLPACTLELVHAASLALDDLPCMDDAQERRGQPSVHARYGEEVALLAAVALLNEAYALAARAPGLTDACRVELVRVLSDTVGPDGLTGGQELDLRRELAPNVVELSDIHRRKTGVLFVAAVEIAAAVAGAEEPARQALRRFAEELGLAFQALDDIADADEAPAATNVISVIGHEGARRRAARRLQAAKAALGEAGLNGLGGYVDLLLGQVVAMR